jgi:Domain of unknown function (DUF4382)
MRYIVIFAVLTLLITACNDNSTDASLTGQDGRLKIYISDSPSSLDSVVICVSRVEVHKAGSDSTSGWFVINDSTRCFDLLQLRNGATAVLGDSMLSAGHYTQIRLIITDGSYVVDNGLRFDLTIPSGYQTGFKLTHEFTIDPGVEYELLLDFDVNSSIIITGNGLYKLKPTCRIIPMMISGSISGIVLPLDADATIWTTFGTDTISAFPDTLGYFKLFALHEGMYDLNINPSNSAYRDTVISDVQVNANQNTDIGTVVLNPN